ncbi:MAG: hypothetical protein ACRD0P_08740, partial [Stackebrandtia sp.]
REYGAAALDQLRATDQGRRLRPYFDALPSLVAEATGAREAITVRWRSHSCEVRVHEHAMFGSETSMSADVNHALTFAQTTFGSLAADLFSDLVEPEFVHRGDHR